MVRLLPSLTLMPPLTVRLHPSARMRFTLPVTVTRVLMVTLLFTTYQPSLLSSPHVVSLSVTSVALSQVCFVGSI